MVSSSYLKNKCQENQSANLMIIWFSVWLFFSLNVLNINIKIYFFYDSTNDLWINSWWVSPEFMVSRLLWPDLFGYGRSRRAQASRESRVGSCLLGVGTLEISLSDPRLWHFSNRKKKKKKPSKNFPTTAVGGNEAVNRAAIFPRG